MMGIIFFFTATLRYLGFKNYCFNRLTFSRPIIRLSFERQSPP